MKTKFDDTIAAPATIPGTGALTVIRISGPETFPILDKCFRFLDGSASSSSGYTIKYATICDADNKLVDEVLVSFFRAPKSYTGEDSAEVSCHASKYIAGKILDLLIGAGARMAEPGEFTRRAFVNGKMDLAQAEAVADVIASSGAASHRIAMNQLKGGISNELASMRADLLDMTSLLELELDFSEEDVEFADRGKLRTLLGTITAHVDRLADSFSYGNAIRNGVPVAIVGAVNSGKSTLLNALVGEDRAIVSDIEGTTRDTVEEVSVIGGIQFRFIDTAGLRETSDEVENLGIGRTRKKLSEASVVLVLADSSLPEATVSEHISSVLGDIDFSWQKAAILLNKTDIPGVNKNVISFNNFVLSTENKAVTINISAKYGSGLDELKKWLVSTQESLPGASEDVVVSNLRHYEALTSARTSLLRVREGLDSGLPSDLIARDLREALDSLASITGEITTQEVLNTIFERHCIGK